MSEWIEYTGSDEQIELIRLNLDGIIWKDSSGFELTTPLRSLIQRSRSDIKDFLKERCVKYILLCKRHPCADLIKIWADTGCPVYIKPKTPGRLCSSVAHGSRVDWNHDDFEFSLTPFETQ